MDTQTASREYAGPVSDVLIIDDNDQDQKVMRRFLSQAGYADLVSATSGQEGLQKAVTAKPVLIILDVTLPEMDGGEVYSQLREKDETKNTPVIFLTGLKTEQDDIRIGFDVGPQTIFGKPFYS